MNSQVKQIFGKLKCLTHQQSCIVQVCVSSFCTESNRLCCLQCVDEHHSGQDHTLVSHQKFNTLLQEFHAVLKEKQLLDVKLLQKLSEGKKNIQQKVVKYFELIEVSLTKETELRSYEQINQVDLTTIEDQELRKRMNELVANHAWMLELNSKGSETKIIVNGEASAIQAAKQAIRVKYSKLERRLDEINDKCQRQIIEAIQNREVEIKKLFHLFDEVKYKIEDDGKELENFLKGHHEKKPEPKTPEDSPQKAQQIEESEKKVRSVFGFLGSLVGGSSQ